MRLYIVTLSSYNGLGDVIVKVFSDKAMVDQWMNYAELMERELYGVNEPMSPVRTRYRIREADLDNLDYIDLYTNASKLGSKIKPSEPQV